MLHVMITSTTFSKENYVTNEETVTISKSEYESLLEDSKWLRSLEDAGVDNWQGIDFARELHNNSDDD